MNSYILEMKNIRKEFPGVYALDDVNFKVKKGSIHALCGENGAGKSTLMKVLSGFYSHSDFCGEILVNNESVSFTSIKDSAKHGIAIIYQELALVKQMSICENIFLGNEITQAGKIRWNEAISKTNQFLKTVGLNINPLTKVKHLGVGQQQLVEIAKAISKDAKILILDEPTAALNETESQALLDLIIKFKNDGVTCIYISHKLNEVLKIADEITVLRDGKTICTLDAKVTTEDEIISKMVGRNMSERYPKVEREAGDTVLNVENWCVVHKDDPNKLALKNISFEAKKGEVLGIAGLMGAGRTELMMSLFGAYGKKISGEISINGKVVDLQNPNQAIHNGLGYLSEDRKRYGLVLGMNVSDNICLASLKKLISGFRINPNLKISHTQKYVNELRIKTPTLEQKVRFLSGGNQQKVVLAKWIMIQPQILILDEPTRGIDVGAKYEIYNIINDLVARGMCIIVISSELPEVMGISDRILVMCEGEIKGELFSKEASDEDVMKLATGGDHYGKICM